MPSEITYYMNRVSELRRERDEAREQVQTLRAALDRIRMLDDYDHAFAADRAREIARKALAALEDD